MMVSESISSSSMTNLSLCWVNGCVHPRFFPFLLPTFHQISTLEKTIFRRHSNLSSLMSYRPSQVSPILVAAHSTSSEVFDFHIWFSPGFLCSRGKHVRIPYAASRDQIHHRLRFCCDSFFTCIFLRSSRHRHRFALVDGAEMADVEQTQKTIPFITCEISLCQYVCELFFCQCI